MISKQLFQRLFREYESDEQIRDRVIRESRSILRHSKQAIFDLHRDDIESAKKSLSQAESLTQRLLKRGKTINIKNEGSFRAAIEEFIEAQFFHDYITKRKLKNLSHLDVSPGDAISALADFSGELVRYAVKLVTRQGRHAIKELESIKAMTEEIVGGLMKFHLTGKLRSKHDDAKRNLKRIEEMLYDLSLMRYE